MPDYLVQRVNMTACQLLASGVTNERLLEAFREIPRESFVPAARRESAYADAPLEIVQGRWMLAPATFARLLQIAVIAPTDSVLDVGCLTGYSTAVLSRVASRVTGLEQDAELVHQAEENLRRLATARVQVVQGALRDGHRAHAPYDVIVVNGGVETPPEGLLAQLAEGGRLVAIQRRDGRSQAILYQKENGQLGHRLVFDASAPILRGFKVPSGFVF